MSGDRGPATGSGHETTGPSDEGAGGATAQEATLPSAEFAFPAVPESAAPARRFITETLQRWSRSDYLADAVIVGYELVANAIQHARTPAVLRLHRTQRGVLIEVVDGAPALPQVTQHDDLRRASGRGLRMVAAVAARWGSQVTSSGKVVWAELDGTPKLSRGSAPGGA